MSHIRFALIVVTAASLIHERAATAGGPALDHKPKTEQIAQSPLVASAGGTDRLAWPLCARELSAGFGYRVDPLTGRVLFHAGLDLREDFGVVVRAARAGIVVSAERRGPYGLMIELDHGNGIVTRYAQLQMVEVRPGERVAVGQPIARVGSSGRSTGPHLHFEVWRDGAAENPIGNLVPERLCADLDGEEDPPADLRR